LLKVFSKTNLLNAQASVIQGRTKREIGLNWTGH